MKDKLFNDLSKFFAKKECAVHYLMKHPNIVEVYDYIETPTEYQLFMEYAD